MLHTCDVFLWAAAPERSFWHLVRKMSSGERKSPSRLCSLMQADSFLRVFVQRYHGTGGFVLPASRHMISTSAPAARLWKESTNSFANLWRSKLDPSLCAVLSRKLTHDHHHHSQALAFQAYFSSYLFFTLKGEALWCPSNLITTAAHSRQRQISFGFAAARRKWEGLKPHRVKSKRIWPLTITDGFISSWRHTLPSGPATLDAARDAKNQWPSLSEAKEIFKHVCLAFTRRRRFHKIREVQNQMENKINKIKLLRVDCFECAAKKTALSQFKGTTTGREKVLRCFQKNVRFSKWLDWCKRPWEWQPSQRQLFVEWICNVLCLLKDFFL